MHSITIGMDLGDKKNQIHVLNAAGETIKTDISIENTAEAIRSFYTAYEGALVALEAGTHSGWISRLLTNTGCEVLVGNPRKLRVIWESDQKTILGMRKCWPVLPALTQNYSTQLSIKVSKLKLI